MGLSNFRINRNRSTKMEEMIQTVENQISDMFQGISLCTQKEELQVVSGELNTGQDQFWIMLRIPRFTIQDMHTLDVVQIGWLPLNNGDVEDCTDKKKGSATPVWIALERFAKDHKRILRIESILSRKLLQYLKKTRGYVDQENYPGNLLCMNEAKIVE